MRKLNFSESVSFRRIFLKQTHGKRTYVSSSGKSAVYLICLKINNATNFGYKYLNRVFRSCQKFKSLFQFYLGQLDFFVVRL